jgi:hypothetical protein
MTQGNADTVDAAFVSAQHDLAARLRDVADRLEQLSTPAAIDLLPVLRDPVRAFLQTAERLIARATWTAASL